VFPDFAAASSPVSIRLIAQLVRTKDRNRAAFAKADVEDAKRGHPAFDLRDYAARRGLEFIDHDTPAGFRAVVPCEPELRIERAARADAIVRVARLRPTKAIPVLNLGVPA
jgi:hypothetical protein